MDNSTAPSTIFIPGILGAVNIVNNYRICTEVLGASGEILANLTERMNCQSNIFEKVVTIVDPNFNFEVASAMFPPENEPINETFKNNVQDKFDMEIIPVNYKETSASFDIINEFVYNKTEGHKPNFLDPRLNSDLKDKSNFFVYVFNVALQFQNPTFEHETSIRNFTLFNQRKKEVPFIKSKEKLTLDCREYGNRTSSIFIPIEDPDFTMEIIQPEENTVVSLQKAAHDIGLPPTKSRNCTYEIIEIPRFEMKANVVYGYYYERKVTADPEYYAVNKIFENGQAIHSTQFFRSRILHPIFPSNTTLNNTNSESDTDVAEEDKFIVDYPFLVAVRYLNTTIVTYAVLETV